MLYLDLGAEKCYLVGILLRVLFGSFEDKLPVLGVLLLGSFIILLLLQSPLLLSLPLLQHGLRNYNLRLNHFQNPADPTQI